jgi:hypothetical protein
LAAEDGLVALSRHRHAPGTLGFQILLGRRAPLASARSGQRERVFMITGIGVHDRTDWPFTITGMRKRGVGHCSSRALAQASVWRWERPTRNPIRRATGRMQAIC